MYIAILNRDSPHLIQSIIALSLFCLKLSNVQLSVSSHHYHIGDRLGVS